MKTVGIALLFLLPLTGRTGDPTKPRRDPWEGFEVGSWVILRDHHSVDGKIQERVRKRVIASYENGAPKLENTTQKDGKFGKPDNWAIHVPGAFPEESAAVARRKETLSVGKAKLPCAVTEYVIEEKKTGFKGKLVVWRSATAKVPYREIPGRPRDIALPGDILRAEYSFSARDMSGNWTVAVVALEERLKVGNREVPCVVEQLTFDDKAEGQTVSGEGRRWLSREIPGHEARATLKGKLNGKALEAEKQALDFKASRRKG
jgi:hypothetical protein